MLFVENSGLEGPELLSYAGLDAARVYTPERMRDDTHK